MKKEYKEPIMNVGAGILGKDIAQSIGVGSGDQLGKDRKDDFEEEQGGNDSWSKGLW